MKETPLISVIKLQSAESLLLLEEARQYIDVDKVFEKYPKSKDAEEEWKQMVTFFYDVGGTKKFTNHFKYFDYHISQTINSSKAEVSFVAINKKALIKEIIYSLSMAEGQWKVIDIQYKN